MVNRKVLVIAHEIDNRYLEGFTLFNMSTVQEKLGHYTQAINLATTALNIWEQIEHPKAAEAKEKLDEWHRLSDDV